MFPHTPVFTSNKAFHPTVMHYALYPGMWSLAILAKTILALDYFPAKLPGEVLSFWRFTSKLHCILMAELRPAKEEFLSMEQTSTYQELWNKFHSIGLDLINNFLYKCSKVTRSRNHGLKGKLHR